MQIRVIDGIHSRARVLPDLSGEEQLVGGFKYPELGGNRWLHLAFIAEKHDQRLIVRPLFDVQGGSEIAVQSFERSDAPTFELGPRGRSALTDVRVEQRAPQPPVLTARLLTPVMAGDELGQLVLTFRAVWPKTGRFMIHYGQQLLADLRTLAEPYGPILRKSTALRFARILADRNSEVSIEVGRGGSIGRDFLLDLAAEHVVSTCSVALDSAIVQIRQAVPTQGVAQTADVLDDMPIVRRAIVRAP